MSLEKVKQCSKFKYFKQILCSPDNTKTKCQLTIFFKSLVPIELSDFFLFFSDFFKRKKCDQVYSVLVSKGNNQRELIWELFPK